MIRPPVVTSPRPCCCLPATGALGLGGLFLLFACSLTMDEPEQCSSNADCVRFGDAVCDVSRKVCVPSGFLSCADSAVPPSAPSVKNAGDQFTFEVAINTMDFGEYEEPPAWASTGYNLDGVCTTLTSGITCASPAWAGGDTADGLGGRDNGVGRLIAEQVNIIGANVISSKGINDYLRTGRSLPMALLRIIGYSGKPDDDQLTVEWYDPGERTTPGEAPAWDGSDGWAVTPDSVDGWTGQPPEGGFFPWPLSARFAAREAYINNYTLVARFDEVVTVNFLQVPTQVHSVTLTAKMVQDPLSKAWRLDQGVLSARLEARTFLGLVPAIVKTFVGVDFCMDDPQYPKVKRLVCAFTDLPAEAKTDPAETCSFISLGARVTALPVRFTGVAPKPDEPPACPTETDPIHDSCDTE